MTRTARTATAPLTVTYGQQHGLPVAYCGGHTLDCGALDELAMQQHCTLEDAARFAVSSPSILAECRIVTTDHIDAMSDADLLACLVEAPTAPIRVIPCG